MAYDLFKMSPVPESTELEQRNGKIFMSRPWIEWFRKIFERIVDTHIWRCLRTDTDISTDWYDSTSLVEIEDLRIQAKHGTPYRFCAKLFIDPDANCGWKAGLMWRTLWNMDPNPLPIPTDWIAQLTAIDNVSKTIVYANRLAYWGEGQGNIGDTELYVEINGYHVARSIGYLFPVVMCYALGAFQADAFQNDAFQIWADGPVTIKKGSSFEMWEAPWVAQ